MASELVRHLVNSGIHFGHRISRWNPKMSPFIFGRRNMIHIIDIRETVKGMFRAKKFISMVVARGDDVLFVGTKRQARHIVVEHAQRVGMPYVCKRWLGGTLTNFRTIRSRLGRLEELEQMETSGDMQQQGKKQFATLQREQRKIKGNLEGIRTMDKLPGALLVIDVRREHLAVKEAKKLRIPTVCLIDTDSDPDFADIPIPGNDDSMRSIETIVSWMADAIEEGLKARRSPSSEPSDEKGFQRRSQRPASGQAGPEQILEEPEMELASAVEKDSRHRHDQAGETERSGKRNAGEVSADLP